MIVHAEVLFQKLLETYRGEPDKQSWDGILHEEDAACYG